jgi:hypothetical protein
MQAHGWRQFGSKLEVGGRRGFHNYERAGERHEHTPADGLGFGGRACIRHNYERASERASKFTAASRRGLANELHPKYSWLSQWRFQISAQIHPKFELASQSVVIKKAHPKFEVRIILATTVYVYIVKLVSLDGCPQTCFCFPPDGGHFFFVYSLTVGPRFCLVKARSCKKRSGTVIS